MGFEALLDAWGGVMIWRETGTREVRLDLVDRDGVHRRYRMTQGETGRLARALLRAADLDT